MCACVHIFCELALDDAGHPPIIFCNDGGHLQLEAASICRKSSLKHLVLHVVSSVLVLFWIFCHKP